MINLIKKFFARYDKDDNICNILISLKSDKQIDLIVNINEDKINNVIGTAQEDCAEFLHIINSGKLKNQIISIILDKINYKNKTAIENILLLLIMLEQKIVSNDEQKDQAFILPSKVFTRYINGNQQ
jgi:hypothetical protein